jgi:CheY-like chemotaxis protein
MTSTIYPNPAAGPATGDPADPAGPSGPATGDPADLAGPAGPAAGDPADPADPAGPAGPAGPAEASGLAAEMAEMSGLRAMAAATAAKVRVLVVDDEPAMIDSVRRILRRDYDVTGAVGGAAGIAALAAGPEFAVVISDLRMPEMDGIEFLGRAHELAPDTVRVMLTGCADIEAATAAINSGQVFRFLTKPVSYPDLAAALTASIAQHELQRSERVLLQETLLRSIHVLVEMLTVGNPDELTRAVRITDMAKGIAASLGMERLWEIEAAALLMEAGRILLPAETAERAARGVALSPAEQQLVERVPALTWSYVMDVPRLERVAEIVGLQSRTPDYDVQPDDSPTVAAAKVLQVSTDIYRMLASGLSPREAVSHILDRLSSSGSRLRAALDDLVTALPDVYREVALDIEHLTPGLLLARDVRSAHGLRLAGHGTVLTQRLIERLYFYRSSIGVAVIEPVYVYQRVSR